MGGGGVDVVASTAGEPRAGSTLPYVPALDGLRALAVVAVLAFHAGVPGADGGFLGVSTFFTLSGFLITSLLLRAARDGRPATRTLLVDFWSRRLRRLMPAALVGVGLAALVVAVAGTTSQRRSFPGDVVGAVGDVANWRFVLAGRSYQDMFTEPSPLQHYWSLAIEEQFYLVLPLVAVAAFRLRSFRGRLVCFGAALVALALASGWSLVVHADAIDRTYYGTDTRAFELLVGCLLAVLLATRSSVTDIGRRTGTRRLLAGLGVAALVASIGFWIVTDQTSEWLYPAGFPAYALVSVALLLGALVPGPVAWLLALRPLVALGGISYGVYVLHWPLFLLLDGERLQLEGVDLLAVRVAVTLVLAVVLAAAVERPIRHRRRVVWLPTRRAPLAFGVVAALILASVAIAAMPGAENLDFEMAEAAFEHTLDAPPPPVTTPPEVPTPFLAFAGDASAAAAAYALFPHLATTNVAHFGGRATDATCSLLRDTRFRDNRGVRSNSQFCDDRDSTWQHFVDTAQPDVLVVQIGGLELVEHELVAGSGQWTAIGSPDFDAAVRGELDALIETMAGERTLVALVNLPVPPGGADPAKASRALRFNELLADAAARHPRKAALIDAAGWFRARAEAPDASSAGPAVSDAFAVWLLDQLVAAHEHAWLARHAQDPTVGTRRTRVLVVGDSTALPLAVGLHGHAQSQGDFDVASIARSNCGIARSGLRRDRLVEKVTDCPDWQTSFADAVQRFRPDIVLVSNAIWEIADRQLPGDPRWRSIGDPTYDAHLRAELGGALDELNRDGAVVGVVLYPHIDHMRGTAEHDEHAINDPGRMDRYNELLRSLAAERPYTRIVDLAGHAAGMPGGELDRDARPDGVHYTEESARALADDWLAAQITAMTRR